MGKTSASDIVNPVTGEVIVEKGQRIIKEQAKTIQNLGINSVDIKYEDTVIRVVGTTL